MSERVPLGSRLNGLLENRDGRHSFEDGSILKQIISLAVITFCVACQNPHAPLAVVDDIDLDRFVGRWYEIASFPQRFQEGCVATSAEYARLDETRLRVVNTCRDETFDGHLRRVDGIAWVADPTDSRAKLKVQFFWPFRGDYWVIELDRDYSLAVVGHPSREYLWILARNRTLDPRRYDEILARLEMQGYELDRLRLTPQPAEP
jgi:apolipoprotein D and lipocalin family protein